MRALLLLAAGEGGLAGVGFCILSPGQQPEALQGTGYAASNALTEGECAAAGEDWCPLYDEVKTFEAVDPATQAAVQIEYYWWSACCSGMQVRNCASLRLHPPVSSRCQVRLTLHSGQRARMRARP